MHYSQHNLIAGVVAADDVHQFGHCVHRVVVHGQDNVTPGYPGGGGGAVGCHVDDDQPGGWFGGSFRSGLGLRRSLLGQGRAGKDEQGGDDQGQHTQTQGASWQVGSLGFLFHRIFLLYTVKIVVQSRGLPSLLLCMSIREICENRG